MLKISGNPISKFPFNGLKLIYNLVSFEGEPFLCHSQDFKKQNVISYLVDDDTEAIRWLYMRVNMDELVDYLSKNISLRTMLTNINTDAIFIIDYDYEGEIKSMLLLDEPISDEYLPEEDSFFPLEIPDTYSEQIKKHNIRNLFLSNALYMKAENKEKSKDTGLVRALDASELLGAVGRSWINMIEQGVEDKCLEVGVSNPARVNKAKKEVVELYPLDVARLKVASFAVALCPNPLINLEENKILTKEWLLKLLKEFKDNIIQIDKKNEDQVEEIIKSFRSTKRMKDVFEPLINLYKNKNITVSLTDEKFNSVRVLNPVIEKVTQKLIVLEKKKPVEAVETVDRVIKAKFDAKSNKPIFKDYTLFDLETVPTWQTNMVSFGDEVFKLDIPLILNNSQEGATVILENTFLDIYATGEEMDEVITDVYRQFSQKYNELMKIEIPEILTENQKKQKEYIQMMVHDYEKG